MPCMEGGIHTKERPAADSVALRAAAASAAMRAASACAAAATRAASPSCSDTTGGGGGRTTPHRQPHQRPPDPQGTEARYNTAQGLWGAGFTTGAGAYLAGVRPRASGSRAHSARTLSQASTGYQRQLNKTTHLRVTKGCLRLPHTPASRFLMAQPHAEAHTQQQAARTPTQGSCTAQTTAHARVLHCNHAHTHQADAVYPRMERTKQKPIHTHACRTPHTMLGPRDATH